jgi:hypothetical protein
MSFPWPLDKLAIVNRALDKTGNNSVAVADDGSDEWRMASSPYDEALSYMMESHSWGFAMLTIVLQPSPTPPQDTDFDTAYPLPPDCVHVVWVKINLGDPVFSNAPRLALWKIEGTPTGPVIVVNSQGGPPPPVPPVTPAQITMRYASNAGALMDAQNGTPTIVLALTHFTVAGIYQSGHEDLAAAKEAWLAGERYLQMARTRYDQQKPKRSFFNSRITAVRRIRRPWPSVGINQWGSGSGSGSIPG